MFCGVLVCYTVYLHGYVQEHLNYSMWMFQTFISKHLNYWTKPYAIWQVENFLCIWREKEFLWKTQLGKSRATIHSISVCLGHYIFIQSDSLKALKDQNNWQVVLLIMFIADCYILFAMQFLLVWDSTSFGTSSQARNNLQVDIYHEMVWVVVFLLRFTEKRLNYSWRVSDQDLKIFCH